MLFGEGKDISTEKQQYEHTAVIDSLRQQVDRWRSIPNPNQWQVTPETARLLQHWRHHRFSDIRPFFCQVEAAETVIWLTEVAPQTGRTGKGFFDHLANANHDANPELQRLAVKLATGAGKTTVMAMLIAWQTVNAVRHPQSRRFTRGFLVVTPGITIKDRLRVLQPNDPDSYYQSRELVPGDMLPDLQKARIVITNFHAFKLRDRMELSKGGRSLLQGRVGLVIEYQNVLDAHELEHDPLKHLPFCLQSREHLNGDDDLLHLVVEIKDYRGEDAKEKKATMDTYWVPGVNHHGCYGRWAFAEFTDVYEIESDFKAKVEEAFNDMIKKVRRGRSHAIDDKRKGCGNTRRL